MRINFGSVIRNAFFPLVVAVLFTVFSYMMGYELLKWLGVVVSVCLGIRLFKDLVISKYSGLDYFGDCVLDVIGLIWAVGFVVYMQFIRGNFIIKVLSALDLAEAMFVVFSSIGFVIYVLVWVFSDYPKDIRQHMIGFLTAFRARKRLYAEIERTEWRRGGLQ